MKNFKNQVAAVLIIIAFSCNSGQQYPEISFYYWKTIFKLTKTEKIFLKQNKVKTLFIRYFDVDINPEDLKPFPLSPIKFEEKPDAFRIIPVVYVKNKVMLKKNLDLDSLSTNILSYINQINSKTGIHNDEIQIDCDWSLESRDAFMKFIEMFKKKSKKILSVTIRLHQVKYFFKTKVPSADYGVLMYYNMGKIASDTLNSIYDREIAEKYLNSLERYPLKLDIALPLFSQGVKIQDNKVIQLLSKVNQNSFDNDTNFIQSPSNKIHVKNSNIKFGYYFKQNDEIKIESISFDQLKEMAEDLNEKLKDKPKQIIFFDLDSINLKNYQNENQNFSKITDCF